MSDANPKVAYINVLVPGVGCLTVAQVSTWAVVLSSANKLLLPLTQALTLISHSHYRCLILLLIL
jgi:hypothetical protein